jgi:hypothetical protein
MPTKWLQERAKGSKNEHGMPSLENLPVLGPFITDT